MSVLHHAVGNGPVNFMQPPGYKELIRVQQPDGTVKVMACRFDEHLSEFICEHMHMYVQDVRTCLARTCTHSTVTVCVTVLCVIRR